jgi:hypothetical protein
MNNTVAKPPPGVLKFVAPPYGRAAAGKIRQIVCKQTHFDLTWLAYLIDLDHALARRNEFLHLDPQSIDQRSVPVPGRRQTLARSHELAAIPQHRA